MDPDTFIALSFVEFDIYEHTLKKCVRDYVTVLDVDLVGNRREIERSGITV